MAVALLLLTAAAVRMAAVAAHELAHYAVARLIGHRATIHLGCAGLGTSHTNVSGIGQATSLRIAMVRHAGWCFSVALAAAVTAYGGINAVSQIILWTVAAESVASDVLLWKGGELFFCGNFGIMLLDNLASPQVKEILSTMLRVTMMRGAQSAGLVTYDAKGAGTRKRVVNGKRTDLCDLLMAKFGAQVNTGAISAPQLFQGHTRFATSSIANFAGCHPHQWTPPKTVKLWKCNSSGLFSSSQVNLECFITHNGDLDFYEWHGTVYPLDDVFALLECFLCCKKPAPVDSAGVAGLLDLLRCKGMWHASVRYGYVFGGLESAGNLVAAMPYLWSAGTLASIAATFEQTWEGVVNSSLPGTEGQFHDIMLDKMLTLLPKLELHLPPSVAKIENGVQAAGEALVRSAVGAFFRQDLLAAGRQLLDKAEGSFGLVLSTSLDAASEIVIAARGQTMSVAFYPRLGMFTFGSESSATKAGLGRMMEGCTADKMNSQMLGDDFLDGFRFDLDDVNGEVMLLRWGKDSAGSDLDASKHGLGSVPATELEPLPKGTTPRTLLKSKSYHAQLMRFGPEGSGAIRAYTFIDGRNGSKLPMMKRVLRLGGNPFVEPLPKMGLKDPVGDDIAAIPDVIRKIQDDWNEPSSSLNRLTAFTLKKRLQKRLLQHDSGTHDGSVDLLITGCEVSLWIGEQFASDLHNAFPKLKIVTMSANKLLAQLGQAFPVPNTGFLFNETSYNFSDSNVLLISHSGGTFATLNVSNLLKGFTANLFVVTSEWDTQIAKSVRAGRPGAVGSKFQLNSYVFTTFCGCRPAEPVTLTAVATHQVLTQVLLYLMYAVRYHMPKKPQLGGSTYTIQEVQELEGLNQDSMNVIEAITRPSVPTDNGRLVNGKCRHRLLKQGRYWAQHILEGPIAWILSMIYIVVTVTVGATPLSAIVGVIAGAVRQEEQLPCEGVVATDASGTVVALGTGLSFTCATDSGPSAPHRHIVGFIDSMIYTFLPIWMTWLLRLAQGRPWLHRVNGRSLLIGDIPWVSQTLEAYVSKMFALSYSIASVSVSSGNPLDHLVHRHTHRVVRGALLAVGRPDGRLNALTSAENTICLSVNQASSIQNFGVTCESITIGHNPFKLGLTANAIFIPGMRRPFLSEYVLEREQQKRGVVASGLTASALMSILSTADMETFEGLAPPTRNGERPEFIKRIEPLWGKGSLYEERFIGAWMASDEELKNSSPAELMEKQGQLQEIYEGRIASMERLVSFMVMFHAMAKSVQDFWPKVSFGLLGYDMSRSQSIMRIATTASPVSGSDVRHKMLELAEHTAKLFCANVLKTNYMRKHAKYGDINAQIAELRRLQEESFHAGHSRRPTREEAPGEERQEFKDVMAMDTKAVKGKSPSVRKKQYVRGDAALVDDDLTSTNGTSTDGTSKNGNGGSDGLSA